MDDEIKDILISMADPDFEEKERVWNYIQRLRAERRWIPVSERLPEPDSDGLAEAVLVVTDSGVRVGRYGDRWHFGIGQACDEPTHWMPLPEPPEVT
jgi:hypothetical protein